MQYIRLPAGRSVKMSVSKVEETDMGSLAEGLPHFNVAIESRKAVGGMSRTSCTSLPRRT